jgi:diacylglycerol kinase family enzyme
MALSANGRQHAPMGIVPLGTANNLAHTLGIAGPESRIASALASARAARIAIGEVRGPGRQQSGFLEAAGLGMFSWMLRKADDKGVETPEGGIKLLQKLLGKAEAKSMQIEADGQDLSGEYLMAEVMNVSTIGPRLAVAPEADHTDDDLDLILVSEAEREALAEYLDSMLHGLPAAFPVSSRRVRRVKLYWQAKLGHVDDRPWPSGDDEDETDGEATIQVERHLELLVP